MWHRLRVIDKVGLVIFGAFLITAGLFYCFEEQFDSEKWKLYTVKRHYMVDNIINENLLVGKSPEDVVELLGYPTLTESEGNDVFIYPIGRPPSFRNRTKQFLLVVFNNNSVSRVAVTKELLEK